MAITGTPPQRAIGAIGTAIVALMLLWPPWVASAPTSALTIRTVPAGYRPVWTSRPIGLSDGELVYARPAGVGQYNVTDIPDAPPPLFYGLELWRWSFAIDTTRLAVQALAVALLTIGAVWLASARRRETSLDAEVPDWRYHALIDRYAVTVMVGGAFAGVAYGVVMGLHLASGWWIVLGVLGGLIVGAYGGAVAALFVGFGVLVAMVMVGDRRLVNVRRARRHAAK